MRAVTVLYSTPPYRNQVCCNNVTKWHSSTKASTTCKSCYTTQPFISFEQFSSMRKLHASMRSRLTKLSCDSLLLYRTLQPEYKSADYLSAVWRNVHVASVLQMTHMLLTHGGIWQSNAMNWMEVHTIYWSAITHDFEHKGVNNDFMVLTSMHLRHHCRHHLPVTAICMLLPPAVWSCCIPTSLRLL